MSNLKFIMHLFILLLLQLTILDNIQLHSYIYINVYILAIYILPYRLQKATILLFGFFLGLFVDLANHTMGIHAAATTLVAYIRPRLLMLTSNRDWWHPGKTKDQWLGMVFQICIDFNNHFQCCFNYLWNFQFWQFSDYFIANFV